MSALYSINSPERLFDKLVKRFSAFDKSPSEDGILDVVFILCHLREWICPGGHKSYKTKAPETLSREEVLHLSLYAMDEYKVVLAICNNTKHFSVIDLATRTDVIEGFRTGLGHCGDSLGVTHYLVDGVEIRKIFWTVYKVYFDYFNQA